MSRNVIQMAAMMRMSMRSGFILLEAEEHEEDSEDECRHGERGETQVDPAMVAL